MRSSVSACSALAIGLVFLTSLSVRAQLPSYPNIGRAPTPEEIREWDIAVGPSGRELPPGRGTAKEGEPIYLAKCAICHAPTLEGTMYGSRLVGDHASLTTPRPVRTVGSFWAYATTVLDYINRAMPRSPFKEGSLTANEVYALTAFVLNKNGIIRDTDVMDAASLPKVHMPNRDGFVPARPDWSWYQRNCRLGLCRRR